MIKYLKDHYGNRPSSKQCQITVLKLFIVNQNERMELEYLRKEVAAAQKKMKEEVI